MFTDRDTIPPVVTCPEYQEEFIFGPDQHITVYYDPPAQVTDNSGENVSLMYSIPTGGTFHVGTTAVTVTGMDASGNRGYCTFKVYVVNCKCY